MSRINKNRVKPMGSQEDLGSAKPPSFSEEADLRNSELQRRPRGATTYIEKNGEHHMFIDEEDQVMDKDIEMKFDFESGKNAEIESDQKQHVWVDTQRYSEQDECNTTQSLVSEGNVHLIKRKSTKSKKTLNQKEVQLYKQQIRQTEMINDKEDKFFEGEDEQATPHNVKHMHSSNLRKKTYLKSYGYKFQIPTLYILEAKTFERDINFVFRLSCYVLPTQQNLNVFTHYMSGQTDKNTFNQIYQDRIGNISLELLFKGDAYPEVKSKLIIPGANWGKQAFTDDHKLYALLVPTRKKIISQNPENEGEERIVHKLYIAELREKDGVPDPMSLIDKIRDATNQKQISDDSNDYLVTFTDAKLKIDLSFTKYMRFENNKRYLVCVGDKKIFVFDILKQKGSIYEISESIMERILDVKFTTNFDKDSKKFKSIKCLVACKRIGFNQVYVYDLFERDLDVDPIEKEQDLFLQQQRGMQKLTINKKQKVFNYEEPATEQQLVKFSRDGRAIMYADQNEKFVIHTLSKGQSIKRKLNQLEDKVVYLITPDPDPQGEGFYVLCSEQYDKYVRILHTHRFDLDDKLRIIRLIEPGVLKCFEMLIKVMKKYSTSELENQSDIQQTKNMIQLVQVRDQYFTIDQISYIETKQIVQNLDEEVGAQDRQLSLALQQVKIVENKKMLNKNLQKELYNQQNIKFSKAEKGEVAAVSINWPYVALSGSNDELIILNAFEHEIIHRVQVFDEQQDVDITQTYITDTNDLFCMVYQDKKYYLFMIDLDATNLQENETEDIDLNQCYKIGEPILIYSEQQVKASPIQKMHVRGSSRKKPLDSGDNCICLFLHGFQVYIWIQNDPRVQGTKVTLALNDPISSFSWYKESDSCIYLMQDDHKMSDILMQGDLGSQIKKKSRVPDQTNDDDANFTQEIKKVLLKYSTIEITTMYQEASMSDTVMAFNYDRMARKLIMILKADQQSQKLDNVLYSFKIFDVETKRVELAIQIHNPTLIGRLLSGLYTIIDGHMYFNNNVIKIRYDLISSAFSYRYGENDFFDYYFNIFNMGQKMDMISNTPIDSQRSHRLAYIQQDKSYEQPYKVIILPYLNERRVYLNNIHKDSDYFYTSLEVPQQDINSHTLELVKLCNMEELKFEDKLLGKSMTIRPGEQDSFKFKRRQSQVFKEVKDGKIHVETNVKLKLLNDYYEGDKFAGNTFTSIISMKINAFKYRVFSQNGILMNQVNFIKQVKKYGQPIAVSPDGLNYIFKKTDDELDILRSQGKLNEEQMIKMYFKFSVLSLTIFGMCHIKDVDLLSGIQNYYITPIDSHQNKSYAQFMRKYDWMFYEEYDQLSQNCYMVAKINNNADVCIQIKSVPPLRNLEQSYENQFQTDKKDNLIPFMMAKKMDYKLKQTFDPQRGTMRICESQIFYYIENLAHNIDMPYIQQKNGLKLSEGLANKIQTNLNEYNKNKKLTQQVIESQGFFEENFEMNDRYLFIRELDKVNFLDITQPAIVDDKLQITAINFQVNIEQGCGCNNNYIKDIRTGNDTNQVAFIIGQVEGNNDTVLLWDIEKNNEQMLIEVKDPYYIIWDHIGKMYILEEGRVIDASQNCAIKAFSFQKMEELQNQSSRYSNMFNKGIRLDGKNQNWLILKGYLSLPFCYMTFVIQDHIEQTGFKNYRAQNKFDPEPYNYIMNKSSVFLDSKFVTEDYDQLYDVLTNFMKIDMELMELLNFTVPQTIQRDTDGKKMHVRKSPLSWAQSEANYKNVSLILNCMSKFSRQNICNFSFLFKELIDYQSFQTYLSRTMFQTKVMENKQILRVQQTFNKNIVSVCGCYSSFTDKTVFQNDLGEVHKNAKGCKTYPVKVQALCVGWIFDEDHQEEALEFFDVLLETRNLDFFKVKGIQILIDFLYQNFQTFFAKIVFPPFLIFSTALMYYIYLNEDYRGRFQKQIDSNDKEFMYHTKESMQIRPWFQVYNHFWFIICLIYFAVGLFKMKIQGVKIFFTFPSEVSDLCLCLLGKLIYILVIYDEDHFSNKHWIKDPEPDVEQFGRLHYSHYKSAVSAQRILFVVMSQLFVFKLFWFMKHMSKKFDTLIEIIIAILFDIMHLVIIMLLWAGVSSLSFLLLGRNQLDFDDLSNKDMDQVSYSKGIGSFYYVYNILLGDANPEAFELGNKSQFPWLTIMYIITTFIIMIHLLNMLIAVMGNTFNERAAIANELFYQNQLRFVRNQWHLINLNFNKLRQIKFLIAACHEEIGENDDDREFEEYLTHKMDNQDSQLQTLLQGQTKNIMRTKKIEQSTQNGLELQMMQMNMRE